MNRRLIYWVAGVLAAPILLFVAARGAIGLATWYLEKRYPPPGRMVLAGGHRRHLWCHGFGTPTIVIEPGMGMEWVTWWPITETLAASHNVCVYDRAGYGWSEAGPIPRTALEEATELHTMLQNARVPTPYLFVGHSVGGFIGRMYADKYANTLSGMVMVDVLQEGVHPGGRRQTRARLLNLVPPLGWERLERLYEGTSALPQELKQAPKADQDRFLFASSLVQLKSERNEFDSLAESDRELARATFPSDLPLVVITAGRDPAHYEPQLKMVHLSHLGKQVRAENSGHTVQRTQPEVILAAVQEVLTESNSQPAHTAGISRSFQQ